MFYQKLEERIKQSQSRLCVGLDIDLDKFPPHLSKDKAGIIEFNKAIIEETSDLLLAYKINTAFYEALGKVGWEILEEILAFIPKDLITIADAKRGDIGNTSAKYAEAFFDRLSFDSITVNPYMGYDSIEAFLQYAGKGIIILVLTSNAGSEDFQQLKLENGKSLFEEVAKKITKWQKDHGNCLMVVGATHGNEIEQIRRISPEMFFLIPGIGAQGGNLKNVIEKAGKNIIINSSRGIIFADSSEKFAKRAREETIKLKEEINCLLKVRA